MSKTPATTKKKNPAGPAWSVEDREEALALLALYNGTATTAAAEMTTLKGKELSPATLRSWKSRHRDRYEEIREDLQRRVKSRSAENHARLAERAAAVVDNLLERLEQEGHEIPISQVPTAARSIATVAGIHTDKARDLRGDPTVIQHQRLDWNALQRSLQAKGVEVVIESTAEEITEAEEVTNEDTD